MKIKRSSGKDETVKFDKSEHKEKVELHTGDEVSAGFGWSRKFSDNVSNSAI